MLAGGEELVDEGEHGLDEALPYNRLISGFDDETEDADSFKRL